MCYLTAPNSARTELILPTSSCSTAWLITDLHTSDGGT